jgi:hypothetical protein
MVIDFRDSESDAVGRTQTKNDTSNENRIQTLTACTPEDTDQDILGAWQMVKGQ